MYLEPKSANSFKDGDKASLKYLQEQIKNSES